MSARTAGVLAKDCAEQERALRPKTTSSCTKAHEQDGNSVHENLRFGVQSGQELLGDGKGAETKTWLHPKREGVGLVSNGLVILCVDLPAHEQTTNRPLLRLVFRHPRSQFLLASPVQAFDATLRLRVACTAMHNFRVRPNLVDLLDDLSHL